MNGLYADSSEQGILSCLSLTQAHKHIFIQMTDYVNEVESNGVQPPTERLTKVD